MYIIMMVHGVSSIITPMSLVMAVFPETVHQFSVMPVFCSDCCYTYSVITPFQGMYVHVYSHSFHAGLSCT